MSGSQKFIARNRAPRVQIEYDVELYGAEKKVQLPFVMGVLSDLSGKAEKPAVADRGFLEIDVDNFDERMRAMAPRAAFTVPNTLTGEGNLAVDLTFEKMDDFSPTAIAEKVDALRPLLEARRQLSDLMAYMDGKSGAETLIETLLDSPALLQALAGQEGAQSGLDAALDTLRDRLPDTAPAKDGTDDTLAALAASAPQDAAVDTTADDVLGALPQSEPEVVADDHADALDALRTAPAPVEEPDQGGADVLADLAQTAPAQSQPEDDTVDVLSGIKQQAPLSEQSDPDRTDDILSGLDVPSPVQDQEASADTVLGQMPTAPEAGPKTNDLAAALSSIEAPDETTPAEPALEDVFGTVEAAPEPAKEAEDLDALLGGLETPEAAEETTSADDVLGGLEPAAAPVEEAEDLDALLGGLEAPAAAEATTSADDVLGGLEAAAAPVEEAEDLDALLGGLETPEAAEEATSADDVLGGLEPAAAPVDEAEDLDALLGGLEAPEAAEETTDADDVLGGLEPAAAPVEEAEDLDALLGGLEAPEVAEEATSADDVLGGLEPGEAPVEETEDLDALLGGLEAPAAAEETTGADDVLGGLEPAAAPVEEAEDLDALLGGLEAPEAEEETTRADDVLGGLEPAAAPVEEAEDLDALLGGLEAPDAAEETTSADDVLDGLGPAAAPAEEVEDLDALLGGLETSEAAEETTSADDVLGGLEPVAVPAEEVEDLDALLGGLDAPDVAEETTDAEDVLGGLEPAVDPIEEAEDLDALLGGLETPEAAEETTGADDDLDALLAGLDDSDGAEPEETVAPETEDAGSDLDDLLAGLEDESAPVPEPTAEEPDLAQQPDGADAAADDLDALLAGLDDDVTTQEAAAEPASEVPAAATASAEAAPAQAPFGTASQPRPARADLNRQRFRIALLGDFTGRAARGLRETGAALAQREPILLDVDTVEEVIEGFATTLTLPVGEGGTGIEVALNGLDDLHPDELSSSIGIFEALSGLRSQLGVGSMADKAREQLKSWSETYQTPVRLPKHSASTSVPADLKLSDFQALIGDTAGQLTPTGPLDALMAQIAGPHIVQAPDADALQMQKAVDEALSTAMRLVLHHPDFQAVESQWRSLGLLARRIETDASLEIVLYDISAEELAMDLAAQEDLAESGMFRLLTDVLDPEEGAGGFSALFGLYTFEETPPHAELLARIGQVAAHVDAPFFAAISPAFLDIAKEDRHPLVAKAWDQLRALPEAAYLGLAAPRFLLRRPYGAKSEPCYDFEFEEFTPQEGLSGMLWANPVVLQAILLAASYKKDGKAMQLGSLMSLGDMPFHYVNDRFGDQVALPCTERNLTTDPAQHALARGYMPVLWMKGRDEIRLGSFRALSGDEIAGPWGDGAPAAPKGGPAATLEMDITAAGTPDGSAGAAAEDGPAPEAEGTAEDEQSLDDLLAGFGEDDMGEDEGGDDGGMDPDLAALLEGL